MLKSIILALLVILLITPAFGKGKNKPIILKKFDSEKEYNQKLHREIKKIYQEYWDDYYNDNLEEDIEPSIGKYIYNKVDLNDDGIPEYIVYFSAIPFCGSGGCNVFIFKENNGVLKMIGEISLTGNPVVVSENKTKGWHDLIMGIGGATDFHYSIIKFNGNDYPDEQESELKGKVKGVSYLGNNGKGFIVKATRKKPVE